MGFPEAYKGQVYCAKDGKRLVVVKDSLECPKIRSRWLPGISTDWFTHTNVYGIPQNMRLPDMEERFDKQTGERVR